MTKTIIAQTYKSCRCQKCGRDTVLGYFDDRSCPWCNSSEVLPIGKEDKFEEDPYYDIEDDL